MNPSKYIYMMVKNDKYELPIMVEDSPKELAVMVGCDPTHIIRTAREYENHVAKRKKKLRLPGTFRRVPIEENRREE